MIKLLCRDCIYPVNLRETRIRVCMQASEEWFQGDEWDSIKSKFEIKNSDGTTVLNNDGSIAYAYPFLIFYECMIALNVETIDEEFKDKQIRRSGKSFSRDYEMLTIEICFLGKSIIKEQAIVSIMNLHGTNRLFYSHGFQLREIGICVMYRDLTGQQVLWTVRELDVTRYFFSFWVQYLVELRSSLQLQKKVFT